MIKDKAHYEQVTEQIKVLLSEIEDYETRWVLENAKNKDDWNKIAETMDYTANSVVTEKRDRITELADAHWNYIEQLLRVSCEPGQVFTFDQMMRIREFDYKSVARHFYGHGWEDAKEDAKNERDRHGMGNCKV